MLFGAFFPLVLVICLGLLVAIIVLVREIRKIIGASEGTGSKNSPVSLNGKSRAQELSIRYKQDESKKQTQENRSEENSTGGAIWRW